MNLNQALEGLRTATLKAQAADPAIAVRVRGGYQDVVRVTYDANGRSTVETLARRMNTAQTIAYLNAIGG